MSDQQLTLLLTCFPGAKQAGAVRRRLTRRLTGQGDDVLQTSVLSVDGGHRASVHDPQRVVRGTLTSALTWGAFGLVAGTNRVESALIWAVVGALCGGGYAYLAEHLLKKDELARLGKRLPPKSSALLAFVTATDAPRALEASTAASPAVASAATIGTDLGLRVFAGARMPAELPPAAAGGRSPIDETTLLSMILVRYPDPATAGRAAADAAKATRRDSHRPQVELIIETRSDGRRRVSDPAQGVGAMSRSDLISWGGFGLVFGALVGLMGGGGLLGFLEDGVLTGLGWAVFGLAAGALYGLWAGRSVSARRLVGIGGVLPPGTSAVLAWADGPLREEDLSALDAPGAESVVLRFNPVPGGAVLEAG